LAPALCSATEPGKAFESGATAGINERWRGSMESGFSMMSLQRYDLAVRYLTNALEQGAPARHVIDIYRTRGDAYFLNGERDKSLADYQRVLRATPTDAWDFRRRAGTNLLFGNYKAGAADYAKALALDPRDTKALNGLAWLRATCPNASFRNAPEAIRLATEACARTNWRDFGNIDTLGAAYAEAGQFDQALKYQEVATKNATGEDRRDREERLALYRQRKPYRDKPELEGD
jgi:tetratricopeptide (TPR) repeat protein